MGFRFEIRQEKDGYAAVAVGCSDPGRICVIPRMTGEIPVREIASHAFAGLDGVCRLVVPDTIRRIGSFAFYNCRNLESIRFESGEVSIAAGITGLCRKLERVEIVCAEGSCAFVRDLIGQTDRDLTVFLELPDDRKAELFFPEYTEGMDEDTHARAFHPWFDGSGIAYRETVGRAEIDFAAYDSLFGRAVADGWEKAFRIALSRVMYPCSLREAAAEQYREYLRKMSGPVLSRLTERAEKEGVLFLLDQGLAGREDAERAALAAAEQKDAELVSALMNYSRPEQENESSGGFDLDELL